MWAPIAIALFIACAGNLAKGEVAIVVSFGLVFMALVGAVSYRACRTARRKRPGIP